MSRKPKMSWSKALFESGGWAASIFILPAMYFLTKSKVVVLVIFVALLLLSIWAAWRLRTGREGLV